MFQSDRFALAIHAIGLAYIAQREQSGHLVTSDELAEMANAHPVHVRRVLGVLREAGLLTSQAGRGGGWRLGRAPETITLLDIYRASEPGSSVWVPAGAVGDSCPDIPQALVGWLAEAETAMERELQRATLADLIASMETDRQATESAAD